ncbi:NADP-dependent malic enzyme-like [Ctenocephalides felis]|uniref:NADP-dependent malic enzyme-like n=1 Tax=Ctenocephalides felis TaxID=7515 RepID=UPI000E6E1045|nr:NADP-dependent malic enzyme-like [Ctenocephalides felis]
MAFTLNERQALGIHGLQPARFTTQEEQMEVCKICIERYTEDINKYLYLIELRDTNERLFYRFVNQYIEEMLPIMYTPTVGQACQMFGLIYRRPRGIFVTISDKGHVYDVLKNWPEFDVRAVCMTDGERILGLGDLGAFGMAIPVAKLSLYTALAGVKPHRCLPVMLDVGTNNMNLLEDPLYIGIRRKRVTGDEYYEFMNEVMHAVARRYGQNTVIHFEDFGNPNAFTFLEKYQNQFCTFNDDIQGTAGAVLAGLICSNRITKIKRLSDHKILFLGAGMAATGIANLCIMAMMKEGITREEAIEKLYMFDLQGLLVKDSSRKLTDVQLPFAKDAPPNTNFADVVRDIKPTVLIGCATAPGAFTDEILREMASFNETPLIFALSNPTSKAECTAKQAYDQTEGRCIYSSGSPFPEYKSTSGKILKPGQANNSYIFPGVALGAIACGALRINDEMFLLAAETLAELVDDKQLQQGTIYPPLSSLRNCSLAIARKLAKYAYDKGIASRLPPPKDTDCYSIFAYRYDFYYSDEAMPKKYPWPEIKEKYKLRDIKCCRPMKKKNQEKVTPTFI